MEFENIAVVGLGLIGGSIAKTVKKHTNARVIGIDSNSSSIQMAMDEGVIESGYEVVGEEIRECDLIFLCADITDNLELLTNVKKYKSDTALVTDVSSVKAKVMEAVEAVGLTSSFIGGHPMAGAETSGYSHSSDYLFENAYYILTPGEGVSEDVVKHFEDFLRSLRVIPLVMSPNKHDFSAAVVSHFPHIVAYLLVSMLELNDDEMKNMSSMAAGGFRDMTRIASSSPEMWRQIILSNSSYVLKAIDWFEEALEFVSFDIRMNNADNMLRKFASSKEFRDKMRFAAGKGDHEASHILHVELVDEAGEIAAVATIMADNGISIKNIGIVHSREYEQGTLEVEFYDEDSLKAAISIIKEHHYEVH